MTTKCIFVLIILNCIISCDPVSSRLKIQNNSEIAIWAVYGTDTLCPSESTNSIQYFLDNQVLPKDVRSLKIIGGKNDWEYYIDRCINKKLNVFVFPIDTIKKYGYSLSTKELKFIKRYSYSKNELDSIEWLIVFNYK
jgi:hypothetical protein